MGFLFSKPAQAGQPVAVKTSRKNLPPDCLVEPDTDYYDFVGIQTVEDIKANLVENFAFTQPVVIGGTTYQTTKTALPTTTPFYYVYRLKPNSDPVFTNCTTTKGYTAAGAQTVSCTPSNVYPTMLYVPINLSSTINDYCNNASYRTNSVNNYSDYNSCVVDIINNKNSIPSTIPAIASTSTSTCSYNFNNGSGSQTVTTTYSGGYPTNPATTSTTQTCDACSPYTSSGNINSDCFKKIWKGAGCAQYADSFYNTYGGNGAQTLSQVQTTINSKYLNNGSNPSQTDYEACYTPVPALQKTYTLQANTDYPGNDIEYYVGAWNTCADRCNNLPMCVGYATHKDNGSNCWMKSGFGASTTTTNRDSYMLTDSSPIYGYNEYKGVDLAGGDIRCDTNLPASTTVADTAAICNSLTGCSSFIFAGDVGQNRNSANPFLRCFKIWDYNTLDPFLSNTCVGLYDTDSVDTTAMLWRDKSGNSNHATLVGSVSLQNFSGFGSTTTVRTLAGGLSDGVIFPAAILPQTFTLITVARYAGSNKRRIFDGIGPNWLSGFWAGYYMTAWHGNGWLTDNVNAGTNNWLLSVDTNNNYYANGTNMTMRYNVSTDSARLSINQGNYKAGTPYAETSEWNVAYVAVFNRKLNDTERIYIENQLAVKFGLTVAQPVRRNLKQFNSLGRANTYIKDPCMGSGDNLTISQECYKKFSNLQGCRTNLSTANWQWDWAKAQGKIPLISDQKNWSVGLAKGTVDGCYGPGEYEGGVKPASGVKVNGANVSGRLSKGYYDIIGQGKANDFCRYVNSPVIGRYVKLTLPRTDWLQVSEFEVYDELGNYIPATASASSQLGAGFEPTKAIDRNWDSIYHSAGEAGGWIQLDLGADRYIGKIIFYNRRDCCYERILGAVLTIINNANTTVWTSAAISVVKQGYLFEPVASSNVQTWACHLSKDSGLATSSLPVLSGQLDLAGTWTQGSTTYTVNARSGNVSSTNNPSGNITYLNTTYQNKEVIQLGSVFGLVDRNSVPAKIYWCNQTSTNPVVYKPYGDVWTLSDSATFKYASHTSYSTLDNTLYGTDSPGLDLEYVPGLSAQQARDRCDRNQRCAGFSYNHGTNETYLKTGVVSPNNFSYNSVWTFYKKNLASDLYKSEMATKFNGSDIATNMPTASPQSYVKGRYVKLLKNGDFINIFELEVYGPGMTKYTYTPSMSSVINNDNTYGAANLNDSNYYGNLAHTNNGTEWVQADLGSDKDIEVITIFNRVDSTSRDRILWDNLQVINSAGNVVWTRYITRVQDVYMFNLTSDPEPVGNNSKWDSVKQRKERSDAAWSALIYDAMVGDPPGMRKPPFEGGIGYNQGNLSGKYILDKGTADALCGNPCYWYYNNPNTSQYVKDKVSLAALCDCAGTGKAINW